MCRISGILNKTLPIAALQPMVKEMCTLMKHGGPDDEGIFSDENRHLVLGHRRLSLIDLSSAGHQPMADVTGRYVISFNGEIYNYAEIKRELLKAGYSFKTGSDTEVILVAFAAWGTSAFEKFNGMFAFALWDTKEGRLFLVRDPSGIKPLYYALTEEGIAFASEMRGFRPVPWLHEENKDWPVFLLAYGHLPEPVTVLKKVKPLQKGTFFCYEATSGEARIASFKKFEFSAQIIRRQEAIQHIQQNLHQSVSRHLIADAPIGVFLSGGVDSGIISLLASEDKKSQLNTLSLHFDESDFSEKKYQDYLLQKMNCRSNQHLLKEQEFSRFLPKILEDMDQPSCDGINTWFISKYARENGLKAVLSGIGGDELYGGYPSFSRMKKVNLLKKSPNSILRSGKYTGRKAFKRLCYLSIDGPVGKYLFLRGQFIPSEIAYQLNMPEQEVWRILSEQPVLENIDDLDAFDQASWMELNMFMQNQLLRDVDVMGMAHGIEIRVPFLDRDFVDLSVSIKSRLKQAGLPKKLLIDAFKNILPEPVWNRPKMGFGFPFKKWFSESEYIKSVVDTGTTNYKNFVSGQMHWSQFLSLVLVENRLGKMGAGNRKPVAALNHISNGAAAKPVKNKRKKILFLTLRTFSLTGGIEKVSKVAGKALYDIARETGIDFSVFSMYDKTGDIDEKYFPKNHFTGFGIRRLQFTVKAVASGVESDVVILSHINLLPVGYIVKLFSPKTQLLLIAHGIEAWVHFTGLKKRMLQKCDQVLSVSQFTKDTLAQRNHFPANKIRVLNNCLDPFLEKPLQTKKDPGLLSKYKLSNDDTVLMTLTRLASRERYKGYDQVMESLAELRKTNPQLKYLIVGKYDQEEKRRLDGLLQRWNLSSEVVFTGFVPDEELALHFNLADIYIMPSTKEGFGIVFIESMYYHKPVIAGNKDGSVDALLNGKLGLLVNPDKRQEISEAIRKIIVDRDAYRPDRQVLMENFSFPVYKEKWRNILAVLGMIPMKAKTDSHSKQKNNAGLYSEPLNC
ncbi:MAG: asparagine synthase (glutamine-hydrolyzing) [Ginsengibacter sp.]